MSIFQLGATLFALFMTYYVRVHYQKKVIQFKELLVWYFLWFCFILFALFPNLLLGFVGVLHFARVFDLLTILAFMVISIISVINYLNGKSQSQKIEEIARQITLKNALKPLLKKRKPNHQSS